MRREEIPDLFLNKFVKIVKPDGFVLSGKIRQVNENNILFESDQATSVINLKNIYEIILKKKEKV